MPTNYFLPSADDQRATWTVNFATKLPAYAAKYGITADEVRAVQEGSAWFTAILAYQTQFSTFVNNITAVKTAIRNGLEKGAALSPLTVPAPELPKGDAPVGVFELVTSVAARIKKSPAYSVADGSDLGIEGTEVAPPDPATLTPVLKVGKGSGGHPELKWNKQGMPQLEICVDRGAGHGWEKLDVSIQARCLDQHELPAAGTSAVWRYKAIYRQKGTQFGQWSEPVSVSVMG